MPDISRNFFATLSRMKYIKRWELMRSLRDESLSEHSLEVAMIAHVLCVIGNVRYGKHLDADRAAVIGLYHDASEIITGDMPTPVKYFNDTIKDAYKDVEAIAARQLLSQLPEDIRAVYEPVFSDEGEDEDTAYMRKLVKGADKLSALIKCMEELQSGNTEFKSAEQTTRQAVLDMAQECPEVGVFMREFLPAYGRTLDELLGK